MTDEIQLIGFHVLKDPVRITERRVIWARFICTVRGFRLESCALVHREDKGWTVWAPSRNIWIPKDVKVPLKALMMERYRAETEA